MRVERRMTQIGHSKRNQVREPAEVEVDVNSQRKTKTMDPNSKEGATEEY